jgi:exopolyphosphatase / guanosine-5'-triphosphate,3'-diphosphate pyrophosphatase
VILAAIDIGTNASRLLISKVVSNHNGQTTFQKLNFIRVPLRLGMDVFESGSIPAEKIQMMLHTLMGYAHLMKAYGVSNYTAVATSAMRDAKNSDIVIREMFRETGIHIDVISGDTEASIIYASHVAKNIIGGQNCLYIDVGGGSTELTLYAEGRLRYKRSFNIGTIRLLKDMVAKVCWDEMKADLKQYIKAEKALCAIGIGGNINKVFSASKKKEGKPLSLSYLKDQYAVLFALSVEERMVNYNLREDRADVIVPALQIFIQVMKWAGVEEVLVPKIGLADGLIHQLYTELSSE